VLIRMVVQAADAARTPLSLCGEMAGTEGTLLLLGLGLRSFRSALHLPVVKRSDLRGRAARGRKEVAREAARGQHDEVRALLRRHTLRPRPRAGGVAERRALSRGARPLPSPRRAAEAVHESHPAAFPADRRLFRAAAGEPHVLTLHSPAWLADAAAGWDPAAQPGVLHATGRAFPPAKDRRGASNAGRGSGPRAARAATGHAVGQLQRVSATSTASQL